MKRFVAIVLPELACELGRPLALRDAVRHGDGPPTEPPPFAVIVSPEPARSAAPEAEAKAGLGTHMKRNLVLDAVDAKAWRYGARPGQQLAEATTFVGQLRVVQLERARVLEALGRVAEIALGFGTTASIALSAAAAGSSASASAALRYPLGAAAGPIDTVWLDVTGCARLRGGEDVLCAELSEQVTQLGHRARVAIAAGPRIAQAVARWKPARRPDDLIVPPGQEAAWLASLPIAALPITPRVMSWLGKLGLLRIDDLARLDRSQLAHRLGPGARELLALLDGRDAIPLAPYAPAAQLVESAWLERPTAQSEPLLFVLKRLTDPIAARLEARGEACAQLQIDLHFDPGVVALAERNATGHATLPFPTPTREIHIELPVSLHRPGELLAALRARFERLELPAPVVTVTLTASAIGPQRRQQLDLVRGRGVDPPALPRLLAELGAALGPGRVGLLRATDSHLPEARSELVALDPGRLDADRGSTDLALPGEVWGSAWPAPTRLLPKPIELGPLRVGAMVGGTPSTPTAADRCGPYLVDTLRLSLRLDGVMWWAGASIRRDYAHGWLRSGVRSGGRRPDLAEACLFVDRHTGRGMLHGWYE